MIFHPERFCISATVLQEVGISCVTPGCRWRFEPRNDDLDWPTLAQLMQAAITHAQEAHP